MHFAENFVKISSLCRRMTYIYHITHLRNLSKILDEGCLWCDNESKNRNLQAKGIAYDAIKERRARREVPTCKCGFLSDYVPFYFAPRSPMLYAIHSGMVESCEEGQEPIIHLVAKAEVVAENSLPFTFTNGHAEMKPSEFYENLADLDKIDWELMKAQYWNDTADDQNRKWRRQAEFLVYNHFPINLIAGIGVISEEMKAVVETILDEKGTKIKVAVLPNWYYAK